MNWTTVIRPHAPEDMTQIAAHSSRHIKRLSPFREMNTPEFGRHMSGVVAPLIARCPPLIACCPEDVTQLYGWICAEKADQVLHFLYVRQTWRMGGIGTTLLRCIFPDLGARTIYVTHPSRAMKFHVERWRLKYNPYLARRRDGTKDLHGEVAADRGRQDGVEERGGMRTLHLD